MPELLRIKCLRKVIPSCMLPKPKLEPGFSYARSIRARDFYSQSKRMKMLECKKVLAVFWGAYDWFRSDARLFNQSSRQCKVKIARKNALTFFFVQNSKSESASPAKSNKGTLDIAKVFPRPASSPMTLKHKRSCSDGLIIDEKKRTPSDSGVELTPVEKFNSSSEGSGGTTAASRKTSLE